MKTYLEKEIKLIFKHGKKIIGWIKIIRFVLRVYAPPLDSVGKRPVWILLQLNLFLLTVTLRVWGIEIYFHIWKCVTRKNFTLLTPQMIKLPLKWSPNPRTDCIWWFGVQEAQSITACLWSVSKSKITPIFSINRYTLTFHMTFIKKRQAGSNQREAIYLVRKQNLSVVLLYSHQCF